MKKLLDFLVQEKLYKRCFCDIEDASRTFFGTNNIASLAYLFSLGAHFARRHDFPPSSHVSRSSDPVPHPRLGLRVNNLQKYIKLSMYGIFDESCEYKRRIIDIYITRIQDVCWIYMIYLWGGNNSGILVTQLGVLLDVLNE